MPAQRADSPAAWHTQAEADGPEIRNRMDCRRPFRRIRVHNHSQRGFASKTIRCAVVVLLLLLAWKTANALWRALFAVGTLWPLADWLQGHRTQLRVGAEDVSARGNLGRLVRTSISIPAPSGKSFEYAAGEDEVPGLYAVRKWGGRTLLVPDLNELTCRKIADCIVDRFPAIGGDHEPGSLLYSERHDPIALGLSKRC